MIAQGEAEGDRGATPLAGFNAQPARDAAAQLLVCCGSLRWAETLAAQRPFASPAALMQAAEEVWFALPEADWLQAFAAHPRIGDRMAQPQGESSMFMAASESEQSATRQTLDEHIAEALLAANRAYEARFGFRYIVFASGRTAPELLAILSRRLTRTRAEELEEAVRQQHLITTLRMTQWLGG